MKILIVGGCGFVGSNLSFYFNAQGHEVTVMDNLVRRGSEFNLIDILCEDITYCHGDIRCKEDFKQLGTNYDVVLECSAQPSATDGYANPEFDFTNNTVGLMNVLEFARNNSNGLIFWSTNKVFSGEKINGIPTTELWTRYMWQDKDFKGINEDYPIDGGEHSIYGMSKAMSDLAVQEYHDAFGLNTVVNRFSCLAGPRQFGKSAQGWVAWFVIAAELGIPLELIGWKGKQVRDVLFANDICTLVEKQIEKLDTIGGEVFTIGGGMLKTVSLLEAVKVAGGVTGNQVEYSILNTPRKADHCVYVTDITKAQTMLNWSPATGIVDGMKNIHEWVLDNREELEILYA